MSVPQRGSYAFRAQLKKELPAWRAEGLVDAATEARLVERYRLSESGMSLALLAVYLLGALLIGGGIIAFVAWNWDDLGVAAKVVLIVGAMVAAHLGGSALRLRGSVRLGHALQFLGTLIFGADIGLMAQIFHVSSNWYGGFGAWALGAYAAGILLESPPTSWLATLLGTVWSFGYLNDHEAARNFLPFVLAAAAIIPALVQRSKFGGALALIGGGLSMLVAVADWPGRESSVLMAAVSLAATYGVISILVPQEDSLLLGRVGTVLGLISLIVPAYWYSFHDSSRRINPSDLHLFPPVIALLVIAGAVAFVRAPNRWWSAHPMTAVMLLAPAILLPATTSSNTEVWLTVAANVVLVAICATALVTSVRDLRRGPFWVGCFLGGVVIVSRFFEFETELWLKALAFIGAGIAVILIGLAFERRLKLEEVEHVA